jgi:limonene-1,2-epoxide hydrolase
MLLNCLRHPVQTFSRFHASLIDQTITANLRQAREHAANGNNEGFERHCGHAERLAERHAPGRVDDVERVAAAGPALLGESTETNHSEPTTATANA